MLLSAPEVEDTDLSKLKMLIGGSALPRGLAEAALARGINVYSGYGMSETCPVLTIAVLILMMRRLWSHGCRPASRSGWFKDGRCGHAMRDGITTGEVVARAPWLNAEYLKNPDATCALWEGDWLHTGDVGHINSVGTLMITDRMRDVIKSGGNGCPRLSGKVCLYH